MRFKALVDKKIRELLDGRAYVGFAVLFVLSFLAVFARLWWPSEIGGLLHFVYSRHGGYGKDFSAFTRIDSF